MRTCSGPLRACSEHRWAYPHSVKRSWKVRLPRPLATRRHLSYSRSSCCPASCCRSRAGPLRSSRSVAPTLVLRAPRPEQLFHLLRSRSGPRNSWRLRCSERSLAQSPRRSPEYSSFWWREGKSSARAFAVFPPRRRCACTTSLPPRARGRRRRPPHQSRTRVRSSWSSERRGRAESLPQACRERLRQCSYAKIYEDALQRTGDAFPKAPLSLRRARPGVPHRDSARPPRHRYRWPDRARQFPRRYARSRCARLPAFSELPRRAGCARLRPCVPRRGARLLCVRAQAAPLPGVPPRLFRLPPFPPLPLRPLPPPLFVPPPRASRFRCARIPRAPLPGVPPRLLQPLPLPLFVPLLRARAPRLPSSPAPPFPRWPWRWPRALFRRLREPVWRRALL